MKRIKFYKSHKELEQAEIDYSLSLSGIENIRQTVELIKRVYHYQPNKNWNKRIKFIL